MILSKISETIIPSEPPLPPLEDLQHPFYHAYLMAHDQPSPHFVPYNPTDWTPKEEIIECLICSLIHQTHFTLHVGQPILGSQSLMCKEPQDEVVLRHEVRLPNNNRPCLSRASRMEEIIRFEIPLLIIHTPPSKSCSTHLR